MIKRHTLAALCLTSVFLVPSAGAQTPIGEGQFIIPPSEESHALDDVAMDGAGNLTVLWTHADFSTSGFQEEVFVRRFSSTEAPLGPPVR